LGEAVTFAKCCWRCGRWGTQQFIEANFNDRTGGNEWECANDRACRKRVAQSRRRDWCPGSRQPMWGYMDRCLVCGRTTNTQKQSIIDKDGLDCWHVALSSRQKRGQDAHRGKGRPWGIKELEKGVP